MLYLRPQRVYKPSATSQYNSDDFLAHLLDQMDESLYRLRLETPRGTSITEDNSQITCYAHIFDKRDGTELTDLLKGRGWRPTWLLDGKSIDSARISEEGYLLTLETTHLPAIYQTVTLQARDTDILLALTDESQDKAWLQRVIASGDFPTHLLKTSEKLLDINYLDKLRVKGLEEIRQDLSDQSERLTTAEQELTDKLDRGFFTKWWNSDYRADLSSIADALDKSKQQAVDEAVREASEMDKQLKVGGRNLFRKEYLIGDLANLYKIPFDALQPRDGDNTYTLSLDYKISQEDKASSPRITCFYQGARNIFWDSDVVRDGEWHHKEYTIQLKETDPSKYPIYGWFTDYGSNNGRTIDMAAVRNVKLERGTVATDWTPAPEDVAEQIEALQKALEESNKNIKLNREDYEKWLNGSYKKHQKVVEEELRKKLGSDDFGKWREEGLPKELVTSQQQAVAEAVKLAGEMDKRIKVGGRNLIVTSRWKAGYLYGNRDEKAYPVGSENYKVLVGYDSFRFDPVYIPTLGESKVTFKLYDNGGVGNGTIQIHAYDKDKKFLWWSCDGWNGEIGHTNSWTLPAETAYIRLGVTNEKVRAKVEFGTVATDWTSAPEDLENKLATLTEKNGLSDEQIEYLKKSLTNKADKLAVNKSFSNVIGLSNKRFKNAFDRIYNIDVELAGIPKVHVDKNGRITIMRVDEVCKITQGYDPNEAVDLRNCSNGTSPVDIQLVLRSNFDALKRQVDSLTSELDYLERTTKITPITDTTQRRLYVQLDHRWDNTIYPKYGDWILTSDVDEHYISFSGLSAEIGRSIYIQTRKRVYLYTNRHTFYGLPGSSTSENQWLTKNTTYRFVRASSDSWLVTSSPSPYPWT